jgi:hypothetical protein
MIFSIGVFLFLVGHYWYVGSETYGDWRDSAQLGMKVVGITMVFGSLATIAVRYLP